MGYALLWLLTLAFSLIVAATLVACAARVRSDRARRAWSRAAVGGPLLVLGALTVLAGIIHWDLLISRRFFAPVALLTLSYGIGGAILLRLERRRVHGSDGVPESLTWPRGRLGIASGVAGALVLLTLWNLDLAAQQRVALLRAETGSLVLAAAPPRVPEQQNAAVLYRQAFDMLEALEALEESQEATAAKEEDEERRREWTRPEVEGFDPQNVSLRKYLARHTRTLALLLEGSSRPLSSFELDYYYLLSWDSAFPNVSRIQEACRLLVLDARVRAAEGDLEGALERLGAVLRIADHVGREPAVIMVLVALHMERVAIDWIVELLSSGDVPADTLQAIDLRVEGINYRRRLLAAFRMEEAFGLGLMCDLAGGADEDLTRELGWGSWAGAIVFTYRIFLFTEDVAIYRSAVRPYAERLSEPYWKWPDREGAVDDLLVDGPRGLVAGMIVVSYESVARRVVDGTARRHGLLAFLAVLHHREREGTYPVSLGDLPPDLLSSVPVDPFDGKPLRYRRSTSPEGKGFLVYSVGPNGKDDTRRPGPPNEESDDIVLRGGTITDN